MWKPEVIGHCSEPEQGSQIASVLWLSPHRSALLPQTRLAMSPPCDLGHGSATPPPGQGEKERKLKLLRHTPTHTHTLRFAARLVSVHLARAVTVFVKVHIFILLTVHAQGFLDRLAVIILTELQIGQTIKELGQVLADLKVTNHLTYAQNQSKTTNWSFCTPFSHYLNGVVAIWQNVQQISRRYKVEPWKSQSFGFQIFSKSLLTHCQADGKNTQALDMYKH